jgi:hypothetical protein
VKTKGLGKHCNRIYNVEKNRILTALHFVRVHGEDVLNGVTRVVLIGSNIAQEIVRSKLYGVVCLESVLYYCKIC